MSHAYVTLIRAAANRIGGLWVRRYRDGVIYAGITLSTSASAAPARLDALRTVVVSLGFTIGPLGTPGTSGERSFQVFGTPVVGTPESPKLKAKQHGRFRIEVRYKSGIWRFLKADRGAHRRFETKKAIQDYNDRFPPLPTEERRIVEDEK